MKKTDKKPSNRQLQPGTSERRPPDVGTPELAERLGAALITYETSKGARRRNIIQVPIDYYRFAVKTTCPKTKKKIPTITAAQHQAGERLHVHFQQAGLMPSSSPTTSLTSITSGDNSKCASDRQMKHIQALRRAVLAVKSDSGKVIVVNVCCYGYLLKDIQLPYHSSPTSLMPVFKEALDDLIKFFGIPDTYDAV